MYYRTAYNLVTLCDKRISKNNEIFEIENNYFREFFKKTFFFSWIDLHLNFFYWIIKKEDKQKTNQNEIIISMSLDNNLTFFSHALELFRVLIVSDKSNLSNLCHFTQTIYNVLHSKNGKFFY